MEKEEVKLKKGLSKKSRYMRANPSTPQKEQRWYLRVLFGYIRALKKLKVCLTDSLKHALGSLRSTVSPLSKQASMEEKTLSGKDLWGWLLLNGVTPIRTTEDLQNSSRCYIFRNTSSLSWKGERWNTMRKSHWTLRILLSRSRLKELFIVNTSYVSLKKKKKEGWLRGQHKEPKSIAENHGMTSGTWALTLNKETLNIFKCCRTNGSLC